jgi:hypothetical protein
MQLFLFECAEIPLYFSMFFYSETYVNQLLNALLAIVKLETKSLVSEAVFLNLVDCDFLFNSNLHLCSSRPEKVFRHLKTSSLIQRVSQITQMIAAYGQVNLIIQHLMQKGGLSKSIFNEADEIVYTRQTREAIFLLNLIITGNLIL